MLQICIGSICLVSPTPPTVLGQSFWNFTGTLQLSFDLTWEICHLLDITAVAGHLAWLAILYQNKNLAFVKKKKKKKRWKWKKYFTTMFYLKVWRKIFYIYRSCPIDISIVHSYTLRLSTEKQYNNHKAAVNKVIMGYSSPNLVWFELFIYICI